MQLVRRRMTTFAATDEALRQQKLLAALRSDIPPADFNALLRDSAARASRGLQAYAAHAGAMAERALAASFPTIAQLVGEASFAVMARAFWRSRPPLRGDLAQWGDELASFIATASDLAEEPYLADVARLDWAVHRAELARDHVGGAATGLEQLATADPDRLCLRLAPGTSLLSSSHPVATIWQAHRSTAADRMAPARRALARGEGEHALVWRNGHRGQVGRLLEAAVGFTQAVLEGQPLGQALDGADPAFDFEVWLQASLRQGWLAAVEAHAAACGVQQA